MKTAKMSKKVIMIVLAVVVLCGIVSVLVFGDRGDKVQELLDLGQSYLEDGNYEQAVATLEALLEIDPKTVKVEESRRLLEDESGISKRIASAYMVWADDLMAEEDYIGAMKIIKEGEEKTGDTRFTGKMEKADDLLRKSIAVLYSPPHNASDGIRQWISQDKIIELYLPLAEKLEWKLDNEVGEIDAYDYRALADAYYDMDMLDKCLQVRKRGYALTKDDMLKPEKFYAEASNLEFDQYGKIIAFDGRGENQYNGNRVSKISYSSNGRIYVCEYDAFKRPVRLVPVNNDGVGDMYEYKGNQVIIKHYTNEEGILPWKEIFTIDQYGRMLKEEGQGYENDYVINFSYGEYGEKYEN